MAGHSKWANIRHRKGAQDAKRGKVFTKLIREITVAAKMGGGDAATNPRLRLAVDKALGQNMPRDTIERAIKRGSGDMDGADMLEIRYEGYGPQGVAIMVDCLTDNHKRTVADVRHAFSKHGGNLGTDGSVSYLFTKEGQVHVADDTTEDQLLEWAIEAGAEEVESLDDGFVVTCAPDLLSDLKEALTQAGLSQLSAELVEKSSLEAPIDELETAQKLMKLIDFLEDLDDVQTVHTNAQLADSVLDALNN